ncbi:hypothetical protein F946_01136 [Acinetobacter johnsonii ANC 3681]|uniref:Uncharacterized protein n=1 Tax=Acinetobacter johnsonii ANC 3681 TaxID=1217662 RepID=N9CSX5_ACIJO|nr:hypothetical protein [Acinetobacter johnsonii]ENV73624.1 hypothetical protein F946_01136 [Acinetobacter johnsonii ANC 3681]
MLNYGSTNRTKFTDSNMEQLLDFNGCLAKSFIYGVDGYTDPEKTPIGAYKIFTISEVDEISQPRGILFDPEKYSLDELNKNFAFQMKIFSEAYNFDMGYYYSKKNGLWRNFEQINDWQNSDCMDYLHDIFSTLEINTVLLVFSKKLEKNKYSDLGFYVLDKQGKTIGYYALRVVTAKTPKEDDEDIILTTLNEISSLDD